MANITELKFRYLLRCCYSWLWLQRQVLYRKQLGVVNLGTDVGVIRESWGYFLFNVLASGEVQSVNLGYWWCCSLTGPYALSLNTREVMATNKQKYTALLWNNRSVVILELESTETLGQMLQKFFLTECGWSLWWGNAFTKCEKYRFTSYLSPPHLLYSVEDHCWSVMWLHISVFKSV